MIFRILDFATHIIKSAINGDLKRKHQLLKADKKLAATLEAAMKANDKCIKETNITPREIGFDEKIICSELFIDTNIWVNRDYQDLINTICEQRLLMRKPICLNEVILSEIVKLKNTNTKARSGATNALIKIESLSNKNLLTLEKKQNLYADDWILHKISTANNVACLITDDRELRIKAGQHKHAIVLCGEDAKQFLTLNPPSL